VTDIRRRLEYPEHKKARFSELTPKSWTPTLGFFMTKYTEQFRLEVVQDYLEGKSAGLRVVAQRYGISSHFTVRKWGLAYQTHGNVGSSKTRTQHSDFRNVLHRPVECAATSGHCACK